MVRDGKVNQNGVNEMIGAAKLKQKAKKQGWSSSDVRKELEKRMSGKALDDAMDLIYYGD